jgi:REP element-mobilizing transposase RayT
MPRRPRAFAEGLYHVGSHGSDNRHLFLETGDRIDFLDRLAVVLERFQLRLVDYALLGNHYHAILGTPGGRISRALQQLHTWYARTHNRRHERSAHLFRAHFFARELKSDSDLLSACRYVAHNPVAAGLCADAFAWPWSSASTHAGLTETAMPLDNGPLRAALGDDADWRRRYQELIRSVEG